MKKELRYVLFMILLMWFVELINMSVGHRLSMYGILPRSTDGLYGIVLAPMLHHGMQHLLMNTLPFIILSALVVMNNGRLYLKLTLLIILLSGSCVWLVGRSAYHVGASGLIFGYFGFLVSRGGFTLAGCIPDCLQFGRDQVCQGSDGARSPTFQGIQKQFVVAN